MLKSSRLNLIRRLNVNIATSINNICSFLITSNCVTHFIIMEVFDGSYF